MAFDTSLALSIQAARTINVGRGNAGAPVGFTALLKEDFLSGSIGANPPGWVAGRSIYNDERSLSGDKSLKISFLSGMGPPACGGSATFGGKFTLPTKVIRGHSLWFRMMLYLPSTLSFGYIYGSGDAADAAECGGAEIDGFGRNKFIVIEQAASTSRMYLHVASPRRSVVRGDLLRIDTDLGPSAAYTGDNTLPSDRWFSLQMQIYAHETNGFYRTWVDDRYVGQIDGATLSSASHELEKFGFGTYWNGTHYTDGQAGRSDFWLDEVIVATDMSGFESPTGIDSNGNPYIDPALRVSDLIN